MCELLQLTYFFDLQYQEDLIIYILNKFSLQIQKKHLKEINEGEQGASWYYIIIIRY